MAEYKGIHGTKVQNYTSDPTNPIIGQVWYNETSQTMKVQAVSTVGSWATGNDMVAANRSGGSNGTQSSAINVGGSPPLNGRTELYNGSTWSEGNDLLTT